MNLDATVKGEAANSYLTVAEADDLIDLFAQDAAWDALDDDAKERMLMRLTRRIEMYRAWGERETTTQALSFPRVCDGDIILQDVKLALMECVDAELDGSRETLKKMQSEGVTSASLVGQNMSFVADPSELPAGARRYLDRLYAAGQSIKITRPHSHGSLFG